MNILVFEDRAYVKQHMRMFLQSMGHNVVICSSCNGVIESIKANTFDCYILDLNVATMGLKAEEVASTNGGLLTGWILLTKYILKKDGQAMEKAVILSDYIREFKRYIISPSASAEEKAWFNILETRGAIHSKSEGYDALLPHLP